MLFLPFEARWEHAQSVIQKFIKNASSFKTISSFISICIQQPEILITFYKSTNPLESALYFTTVLIVFHYIISEITKNYSQVDKAWSILPCLYAWHFAIHDYTLHGSFHPRLLTAAILITTWGSRLTYNFARKGGYYWSGQDYRYPYILKKIGPLFMGLLNLFVIAPFQNYLLLLIVTPLYMTHSLFSSSYSPNRASNQLSCLDWITVVLHLFFLTIEVIADEQQYVFQTGKHALLSHHLKPEQLEGDYKLGFLWHSGLFQFSRHPNFFAEQAMWWTIYLFSVSAVQEATGSTDSSSYLNWTLFGPIILSGLFQGSTWITEKISTEKYPDYTLYRKSVNKFIPWFPTKMTETSDKKEF
ncbi:uncharacterized protein BX663DRAFT_481343 [Cokeromyces recurvatus]|uniref:uncharacterized protein n=1 Tax=Cokeromyces recurvatus TaxID=90255 RepID=UPI00221E8638|nr:uncharacterized protein BX663DRAFT_481343 [Cokeromyces recurvatus]KAI7897736.1 hypothetical protein BX663DRAFT_481343 [Cokeromyces recurvatus]